MVGRRYCALESKDEHGQTPLSKAAENGHETVVKLLLEKGAELRSKDEHGQTPLSKAAEDGHEAIVRLLLERDSAGADRRAVDNAGADIALVHAAKNGHEAVVQVLLEWND